MSFYGSSTSLYDKLISPPVATGTYSNPTVSGYTNAYLFSGNGSITFPTAKTVQILIVGGGGGGGGSWASRNWALNGGGAGGLGYGTLNVSAGTTYNITVGTFGTCLYAGANGATSSGGNSSFIGGSISETAYGGGGGGSVGQSGTASEAQSGGSGGGYSLAATVGYSTTATKGSGTLAYLGNIGTTTVSTFGGTGGGARGVGINGGGGAGFTWPVTGLTYAGGGAGGNIGSSTACAGGSGGGGSGGAIGSYAGNNATYYGGGGGGSASGGDTLGGSGYQGVVIIAFNMYDNIITTVLAPITNLFASSITSTGFTVFWSGGIGGTPVTTTFNINGSSATPTSSGTGTATFGSFTSGTIITLIVTATNSTDSVTKTIVVVTLAAGLRVNVYQPNPDTILGFTSDYPTLPDLSYFNRAPVMLTYTGTNFSYAYMNSASNPGPRTAYTDWALSAQGYFTPNVTGTWTFSMRGDDWMWFYFGSAALNPTVSNTTFISYTNVQNTVTQSLTAGISYPLLFLYGQARAGWYMDFTVIDPNSVAYSDISSFCTNNLTPNIT